MSDQRRRVHERRSAEGDLDAAADWLLAQLRAGEVAGANLRAAAYCGDGEPGPPEYDYSF